MLTKLIREYANNSDLTMRFKQAEALLSFTFREYYLALHASFNYTDYT